MNEKRESATVLRLTGFVLVNKYRCILVLLLDGIRCSWIISRFILNALFQNF